MTSHHPKIEVLSGPERRWSTAEKLSIIQETYEPDATVSIVARRYGIQPNQLFTWRKLATQGALTATAAEEDVVPASEYRALQNQVKELQRLLGKKTMEGDAGSQPSVQRMAEAFVKTFKRDYVSVNPVPDAETVIAQLPSWFEHYNTLQPHNALGYRSPREFLNRQTEI